MSWWEKLTGRRFNARDPDLYTVLGSGQTWAGESVSVHGAMNLSAYWAGTKITAQTIASLSCDVMERQSNGVKVRVPDHELQIILDESPNKEQTSIEFWEGRVIGLCTTGNGFAEKLMIGNRVVGLDPMPATTLVRRDKNQNLEYSFYERGKEVVLPAEKVFHIKAFGDGDVGMSPVEYARQTLSLSIASEKFAGQTYSKGGRVKGFFVTPSGTMLTPEQRVDAKKNLVEANSGPNAPWASILEGGVDFKTVGLSMRDAEMILNRRFNVEEICRWLGVPPILVGHSAEGQTVWGTGYTAIMQSWLNFSLRAQLKRIEQAIEKRIMTPEQRRRFSVKFNYEDLLRGDTHARSAFYVALLNAGVMTINEVRKIEGLPPVEGGDVPRMQMQNVPITEAGIGHNGGPKIGENE